MMWETAIRVRRSQVIDGEPSRVWSLLSSPEAWSLKPRAGFMFDVPNAERLRFAIGPARTRQGTAAVFEICEELPGKMIRLRVPPARQVFTLSVKPGRRGTTKASAEVSEIVPRIDKIEYQRGNLSAAA